MPSVDDGDSRRSLGFSPLFKYPGCLFGMQIGLPSLEKILLYDRSGWEFIGETRVSKLSIESSRTSLSHVLNLSNWIWNTGHRMFDARWCRSAGFRRRPFGFKHGPNAGLFVHDANLSRRRPTDHALSVRRLWRTCSNIYVLTLLSDTKVLTNLFWQVDRGFDISEALSASQLGLHWTWALGSLASNETRPLVGLRLRWNEVLSWPASNVKCDPLVSLCVLWNTLLGSLRL